MPNCWTSIERLGEQVVRAHTRDQTQDHTHRGLLIDKLDYPIGRVAAGEEVPALEKRLARLRNGNKKGDPQMVSISKLFYFHATRAGDGGRDQIKPLLT
jgi:hypothetical protein